LTASQLELRKQNSWKRKMSFEVSTYLQDRQGNSGKCKLCLKTVGWSRDKLASHKRQNCLSDGEERRLFSKRSATESLNISFPSSNETKVSKELATPERLFKRERKSKQQPSSSFSVCRICMKSDTESELCSLLQGNGKKVEMFEQISGIDVRDNSSHQLPLISSFTVSDFIGQKQQV
jgi:hypothetical protein